MPQSGPDRAPNPAPAPSAADGVLARLAAATVGVLAAPTLDSMLARVADEARALLGARWAGCTLAEPDPAAGVARAVSASAGDGAGWGDAADAAGDAVDAIVRASIRPVRLGQHDEAGGAERGGSGCGSAAVSRLGAVLAVPLAARDGTCLGVLRLAGKHDGTDFDAAEETIASQLAQVAGLALENARLAESARASEARYRALVEQTPAVVYRLAADEHQTPLYYSPRVADLLGMTPEEVLARRGSWRDTIHPDDLPRVVAEDARTTATGEPFRCEYRLARADGSYVWVRDESEPLRDPSGAVVGWQGVLLDIGERKQAEEALRASEERLLLALDVAGMAAWDRRVSHPDVFRSPGMPGLFGLPHDTPEMGRDVYLARVHPDDLPVVAESDRTREAGGRYEVEFRVVWPNGDERWLRDRGQVLLGPDGAPARYLGITLDVTDRKRAERDLRAAKAAAEDAEHRMRDVLEQLADGFISYDRDGRFQYVNAAAEALMGQRREDLIGRRILEAFPDVPGTQYYRAYRSALVERTPMVAVDLYPASGTWIEARAYPSPAGASVFLRDITEERVAADALRDHADRLAAVVAVQEEVAAARPDPDAVMRLVAERVRDLTGAEGAGIAVVADGIATYKAGAGFAAALVGAPYPIANTLTGRCFASGQIVRSDDALAEPGLDLWMAREQGVRSVVLAPLRHEERIVGVLSILSPRPGAFGERDAHLLRLMEGLVGSSLAHAAAFAAVQEASRLKSAFLSTMSHELRTPLNAIIGYAHLLLDGMAGDLADAQTADVREIAGAADRLLALVDDVLDLSRIEAGALALDPEPIVLADLLREVRADVAPQAAAKRIDLAFAADPGLGVVADPQRLRQILLNLVGNAVKFTERGGVEVRARAAGGGVEVAVRDTGIGIAPEVLPHVFDEFRQADSSTTRRYGGSGLGLAISKRLAELHGGTIRAESVPGVGSTFVVWLPDETRDERRET